jgi:hypothetical protein
MLVLGVTVYGRWKLGIGDPTITGWLTAAGFIATALLYCAYALCQEPLRGHRVFWFSLAVALFVLGINKQLDLHVLLEAVGRSVGYAPHTAKFRKWYAEICIPYYSRMLLSGRCWTGWAW